MLTTRSSEFFPTVNQSCTIDLHHTPRPCSFTFPSLFRCRRLSLSRLFCWSLLVWLILLLLWATTVAVGNYCSCCFGLFWFVFATAAMFLVPFYCCCCFLLLLLLLLLLLSPCFGRAVVLVATVSVVVIVLFLLLFTFFVLLLPSFSLLLL